MSTATPSLEDIRRSFERVPPDVVKKASQFAASILADVAGRRGAMDGRIAEEWANARPGATPANRGKRRAIAVQLREVQLRRHLRRGGVRVATMSEPRLERKGERGPSVTHGRAPLSFGRVGLPL